MALLPAPARAEPAWCKGATEKINVSDYDFKDLQDGADPRNAVRTLVGAHCFPNEDTRKGEKAIGEGFKLWSSKLEMSDADWADAVAYTNARYGGSLQVRDARAAWSAWTPIDQYVGMQKSTLGDSSRVVDRAYLADALGPRLSELGRAAFVAGCIAAEHPTAWALCQPDVEALDIRKTAAELRGDAGYEGFDKMLIRLELLELRAKLSEHEQKAKATMGKDPAYAKMFEIAVSAHKGWSSTVDPKLVALALAIDDARVTNSRRASEGCSETTWTAFRGVVSAMPPKSFAGLIHDPEKSTASALEQAMSIVTATPNGYLAALAVAICGRFDERRDYAVRTLAGLVRYLPGHRGPRNAAHTAIMNAGLQLDDRDAKIEYPELTRPWLDTSGGSSGGGWGQVAKVTAKGENTAIEFSKVKSKQQECTNGHYTNRLRQIRSDGTILYEYVCKSWKTVTINEPPFREQTVNARYAGGLKKGGFVYVVEDVVTVAYPQAGAANPIMVAGIPVR